MNRDIVPLQLLIVQLSGKVAAKLANTTIYKQMNDSLAEPFSLDLDQFVDKGERILRISFRFESHITKSMTEFYRLSLWTWPHIGIFFLADTEVRRHNRLRFGPLGRRIREQGLGVVGQAVSGYYPSLLSARIRIALKTVTIALWFSPLSSIGTLNMAIRPFLRERHLRATLQMQGQQRGPLHPHIGPADS